MMVTALTLGLVTAALDLLGVAAELDDVRGFGDEIAIEDDAVTCVAVLDSLEAELGRDVVDVDWILAEQTLADAERPTSRAAQNTPSMSATIVLDRGWFVWMGTATRAFMSTGFNL